MSASAIVGEDLEVRYDRRLGLGPSTFHIPAGKVTAVIGPNGSGKSTLLNVIGGLIEPASGRIDVLGRPPGEVRRHISYVFQSTKVNERLPVTVREVVAMGRYAALGSMGRFGTADREAVNEALQRLDITDLAGRHLYELSGGQRQRVFVAQGLAQDHQILLMDEPLTGLDLISAAAISEALSQERLDGCAVIITTHDLAEAAGSDHVLLLAGRVEAEGPPSEVLTPERLSAAYGSRVMMVEGRILLDDSAHFTTAGRHVHGERRPE